MILLDRSKDISQVTIENKHQSKLSVMIQAEHYNASTTKDDYILWNNHYDYVFTNEQEIDFFITATETQNKLLTEQFEKYNHIKLNIYTIPVGNLKTLTQPLNRKSYSIITTSRLSAEKRVYWLVKAVTIAKQQRLEITFDIWRRRSKADIV